MSTVLVLGGCGAVGSVAARTLVSHEAIEQVVIGDLRAVPGFLKQGGTCPRCDTASEAHGLG
jgi:nucleoside-diphosphate-sugar epimerase